MIDKRLQELTVQYYEQFETRITVRECNHPDTNSYYELVLWDMLMTNNDPVNIYIEVIRYDNTDKYGLSDSGFCHSEMYDVSRELWKEVEKIAEANLVKSNIVCELVKFTTSKDLLYYVRKMGQAIIEFDKWNNQHGTTKKLSEKNII
jgi:hypothetical protein